MNAGSLTLAFAGTPELAAIVLSALIKADDYPISYIFTQPDRPAGRGRKVIRSPVKLLAEARKIPIRQPGKSREIDPDGELSNVDLLVVAAYGMILPAEILSRPKLGCINVHTSLLPRWRGAAPIQRAIQAGDTETGITIMQMDEGLDTGDILLQRICAIHTRETAGTLHDRLATLGAKCLIETLDCFRNDGLQVKKQDDSKAIYASKVTKAEARIDWTLPARELEKMIRAFNPVPVAHTTLNDKDLRVWDAEVFPTNSNPQSAGTIVSADTRGIIVATGEGMLNITRLQLPGKKAITVKDFLNGHPDFMARIPVKT